MLYINKDFSALVVAVKNISYHTLVRPNTVFFNNSKIDKDKIITENEGEKGFYSRTRNIPRINAISRLSLIVSNIPTS